MSRLEEALKRAELNKQDAGLPDAGEDDIVTRQASSPPSRWRRGLTPLEHQLYGRHQFVSLRRGNLFLHGEFDPGSGRTLAACLTHASRAVRPFGVHERRTGE